MIARYYPQMDYELSCQFNPYVLHVGGISAHNCPPAGTIFPKRKARWFELELINTGGGFLLSQDEMVAVRPGMVFFHPPGRVVQGTAPYTCDVVVFDAEYSRDRESAYHEANLWAGDETDSVGGQGALPVGLPPYWQLSESAPVRAAFRNMQILFQQKGTAPQMALKQSLMEVLLYLGDRLKDPPSRLFAHQQQIGLLCRHIDANPQGRFVLEELAQMVNLSPNFLCRVFKQSLGQTLFQYVHRSKMDRASSLMFETNLSIKAVALEVGIENQSYFHALFKRLRGMTPAEYRQRNRYRVS